MAIGEVFREFKLSKWSGPYGNKLSTNTVNNYIHFYWTEGYIELSNMVFNTYSNIFYIFRKQWDI